MSVWLNQPSINLPASSDVAGADVRGSFYIFAPNNPVATIIGPPGDVVPVGTGNAGLHPLYTPPSVPLVGFSIVGATAPTQVLQYDGAAPMRGFAAYNVAMHTASGVSQDVGARVYQNGAPLIESSQTSEAFDGFLGAVSVLVPVVANPGDQFQLYVSNVTSGVNLFVDNASLTIFGNILS